MNRSPKEQDISSTIRFETTVIRIDTWTILRLPEDASVRLPSRGLALVEGTINDVPFLAVLEPDGKGSHWFRIDKALGEKAGIQAGDTAVLAIRRSENWPEPSVPEDLSHALLHAPQAYEVWMETTPLACWDWVRWIGSTKNPETRRRRIAAACDKLGKGERRPCCFNRNLCTEPSVSRNGVLLEPPSSEEAGKEGLGH